MLDSHEQRGLWSQDIQHTIPLKGMHIHAELQDLLSEVSIIQTFTNEEDRPIEAVYTFPLPLDAVLLSFSVTLGVKYLIGVVQERKQAEEDYEEAISEGNTAIMLQQLESGLYTVNVGNLVPNETAIITFRYTQLHHWTNDVLRWHVPTVLAPRYGQPDVEPHQVPDIDLTVEHPYTLSVSIQGLLGNAIIESPSHAIEIQVHNETTKVQLKEGRSFLDRDLILNFRLTSDKVSAVCDRDIEGYVALASFYPSLPEITDQCATKDNQPRLIKLLVDCSGSMEGESIGQTRIALLNILDSLNERDRFSLIRFGSTIVQEIYKPLQATKANIVLARNVVAKMDADLGGTEIFAALEQSIRLSNNDKPADILLITDGEVWDESGEYSQTNTIIQLASQTQHRIFTVGVGSSVSERLVRELAEGTQGACELVNPGEGMAEKIERHFKRIYSEQAKSITVEWSTQPSWQTQPKHFFIGDTLHILATFQERPQGTVKLTADFGNDLHMQQSAEIKSIATDEDVSTLARLIASQQLKTLTDREEKVALAVKYQLMCEETAYLIIDVKPEDLKTDGMPDLRKVPHMLASGWGGLGRSDYGSNSVVMECCFMEDVCDQTVPTFLSQEEEARLVRRGVQIIQSDDWIELPFPDDMADDEAELLIDGERVLARGLMQVKRSSRIQLKLVTERCAVLAKFHAHTPIYRLELWSTQYELTDADLAKFVHLTQLKELVIVIEEFDSIGCHLITDRGLAELTRLTHLEGLALWECHHITDQGLAELAHLAKLQILTLYHCHQITNDGVAQLPAHIMVTGRGC